MKKLSKIKLKKFRDIFIQKRDDIIRSMKNADRQCDSDGDEIDIVQSNMLSDLVDKLSERDFKTLEKISIALEKIDSGIFGECEECGEMINEKRLLAIPGVSVCVDCAEDQERTSKQFVNKI